MASSFDVPYVRDRDHGGLPRIVLKTGAASGRLGPMNTNSTMSWTASRGKCWPGAVDKAVIPGHQANRALASQEAQWPEHIEQVAASSSRVLVPRGTFFTYFINDSMEPRRSGVYEFCVVGVDMSLLGQLRYYAWEPTGRFDRTFSFDEVERKLAMERFGRSVGLRPNPDTDYASVHAKEIANGARLGRVVRWPDNVCAKSLIHYRCLPNIDERGRPVLPPGSRFPPRNSTDLLGQLLLRWKKSFDRPLDSNDVQQFLVLDGSARLAVLVRDEFPLAEVVAADDPTERWPGQRRPVLRSFRESRHQSVDEKMFDRRQSLLHYADGAFTVVVLPFVFHRLCDADEQRFLALLRESLRVACKFVLIAEDVVPSNTDEATFRRWKALLTGEWSVPVLLDGELRGGPVPDHFLSESGIPDCARRFLILQARPSPCVCDSTTVCPGEGVEVLSDTRTHCGAGITDVSANRPVGVNLMGKDLGHQLDEEVKTTSELLRRPVASPQMRPQTRGSISAQSAYSLEHDPSLVDEEVLADDSVDGVLCSALGVAPAESTASAAD